MMTTTPPAIASLVPRPSLLWPPNHRWVEVTLTISASDQCDPVPTCGIISLTSSEPADGRGDGSTTPDMMVTGALRARLRAERRGGGGGRLYTLTVQCADTAGNKAPAAATVAVPAP